MRAITDDMIHMLLERLSKRNITIWTEAGKIKYKAPAGALTSEELQCIKENKEKIIKYLENHAIWSKGVKETFPLTSIQKAYLIGSDQAYELGGINAHYYMELNCCDIDVVRFERAVNEVIARTDAMRTIVLSNGMQAVLEKVPTYKIERFEFGNEKDREEKREQWSHCVFDLCKWPLYNIRISYVNKAFPRIHIDFDCIIMDAWSAKMMIAKIFEVYEGKIVKWGTYSFKQYCLEQKEYRETHPENAAYSYWRKRVTELPPAPDLPYKKKLSELCGHRFDRISQKFSREETSALYKLVKDNRVTPAALICTMYMKTLMQYSKNKEFSLNLTLFNRLPLSEEIYNLIGDFTNIGAIAYRQQKDFWQEVNFVQKQLWELVRYHSFDGTQILKMIDPMNRGKAILPVVFTGVLQGDRKTKGFLPNGVSEGYAISQTPQVVLDYQATDFNGELLVNWDYVIDPLYGRMADTGIIGVLTHDGYMEFVVPNCETSVETPDKKEDTHEEEIEKPIVKEIMKIWKEVFEIEDISIQDDFYTLGGDSIILMRLVDEMCKTLGCDVTVDDILQSENISDLANRV